MTGSIGRLPVRVKKVIVEPKRHWTNNCKRGKIMRGRKRVMMEDVVQRKKFPRVGVGGLVVRDGKVLLQLRIKPPEAGCWSLPGGKVEWFETVEEALLRELSEEVGIGARIVMLLCVTNHILKNEDAHWVSPAFLVEVASGQPVNREPLSSKEVRWFAFDELPENLTNTARNAIEAYLRPERLQTPQL
jgi:ADP-ribose pyrophosphatase YjhB (NUDIX family)